MIAPVVKLSSIAQTGDTLNQAVDRLGRASAVIVDISLPQTHHPIMLSPMFSHCLRQEIQGWSATTCLTAYQFTGTVVSNKPRMRNRVFRDTDAQWEAFLAKAAERGENVSDVLRKAVSDYLRKR